LPYENVRIAQPDTDQVPNSGPTVASRTVMVVGNLVRSAAFGLKQTLFASGLLGSLHSPEEFRAAAQRHVATHGALRSFARLRSARGSFLGRPEISRRSLRYICLGPCTLRRSPVDLSTYTATVEDFVALQEGRQSSESGLGARPNCRRRSPRHRLRPVRKSRLAKMAECKMVQMTNYIMPTSADLPPIRVFFERRKMGNIHGAYGAKGNWRAPDGWSRAPLS